MIENPFKTILPEEEGFQEKFCDQCEHENFAIGKNCPLLTQAIIFDYKELPEEWISDEQGDRCTKFVEKIA